MFKQVLIAASIAACACASNVKPREVYEKMFFDWMEKHGIQFNNGAEFVKRLAVFADNVDYIETHNSENSSFKLGLNHFSHLTFNEFLDQTKIGGARVPNLRRGAENPLHAAPVDSSSLPTEVDWVSKGAVTPVKDQGNCGSCWSFSTTGALESAYFNKYGSLKSFSEQHLVSCDTTDLGCNGGWMDDAFTWVKKNGGICYEGDYPYTSGSTGKSGSCNANSCSADSKVAPASFTDVTPKNVNALMSAVAQQTVSIAIQANQRAFQHYTSGVLTGSCGQNLDHGVLLVGYGTWTDGTPYWKVKNSWGPSWGMDGYILIERSASDLCGVLDAPSYPNL